MPAQNLDTFPPAADTTPRLTSAGVAYREWGSGAPLVLTHGGAGSWRHWARVIPALAAGFRVIALDAPGYGDSEGVDRATPGDDYIAIVNAAIAEMVAGEDKVHIAGFSFGSILAAAAAVALGSKTTSLTLIGAAGFPAPAKRAFVLDSRRQMRERLGREPTEAEFRQMQADNLGKLMIWDKEKIDDWAVDMQVYNVANMRFDSRAISWSDRTPGLLGDLPAPAMLIWGEHDVSASPSIDARNALAKAAKPDVRSEVIADCGHWAMYEAPDRVADLMTAFLTAAEQAKT